VIISSTLDFRDAARRRLPRFLFDYADGGANSEQTLRHNVVDLADIALRQRVLTGCGAVDLKTTLFGQERPLPVMLGPVGIAGMFRRRGEVQAARAAKAAGIPFCLSTVSLCSLNEVVAAVGADHFWFQLYVLRDRAFMRDLLATARAAGVQTLVFTVDMPIPGCRYRDAHSGSNLEPLLGKASGLNDYIGWLGANFDPTIVWRDLDWIRSSWNGPLIIKGILDPDDARAAADIGADGIVVSNHGGRQLDGVLSSARALPAIADAVGDRLTVLADSGVRSGLDVVRMLALGAKGVLLGRAWLYAMAARGEAGVTELLDLIAKEMRVAMTLTGCHRIADINRENLVS
jgi:L-lactate dehydrogenase (cytochrome)